MVAPKTVLVCQKNVMGFQVGGDVRVNNVLKELTADGSQGNRSVVTRRVLGALFKYRTDVPVLGTSAAGVRFGKDEGEYWRYFISGVFEDSRGKVIGTRSLGGIQVQEEFKYAVVREGKLGYGRDGGCGVKRYGQGLRQ